MVKWIVLGSVALVTIIVGVSVVSTINQEARLRNMVDAQQVSNQAVFDRTWKVVQQQAQVTSQYKDDFQEVYADIMQNSDGTDGSNRLLAFIQRVNPQFDSSLYGQLMTSIEANRRDFEREQKMLIDIDRQHDQMFDVFPSNIILTMFGRERTEIDIVTSTKTQETFQSGIEDDVSLFGEGG